MKNIDKRKVMLIPEKILKIIKSNRDPNYKDKIDWSKRLSCQQLHKHTINIIGYFNYNFWCTTDEKKREYMVVLYNNKYLSQIQEKPSNLQIINKDNNSSFGELLLTEFTIIGVNATKKLIQCFVPPSCDIMSTMI